MLNDCLQKETEATITKAVNNLFPRQQQVYKLARVEGFSRKEISDQLNISTNTVKAVLQQATTKLKKTLLTGR